MIPGWRSPEIWILCLGGGGINIFPGGGWDRFAARWWYGPPTLFYLRGASLLRVSMYSDNWVYCTGAPSYPVLSVYGRIGRSRIRVRCDGRLDLLVCMYVCRASVVDLLWLC